MKLAQMREMTIEELQQEVINIRKKLFELRMNKALLKLENTAEIGTLKKRIAQIKTIIREKQI